MLIVNIIGISILAIFLLFIFQKRKKMQSDYMLIVTIVFIAGIFLSNLWIKQELNRYSLILEKTIGFFILPAFLTYAMLLISKDNKIKSAWWWFGSFAVIATTIIFIDLFFLNEYDKEALIKLYKSPPVLYQMLFRGSNIFAFIALIWLVKKLKKYYKNLKDTYSYIEAIRFKWLENFTWIYFINNLIILFISLAFSYWHIGNLEVIYLVVYISIVISLFYLCYNGIKQYSLFEYENALKRNELNSDKNISKITKESTNSNVKYKSSSLKEDEMNVLSLKVKALFEDDEIYLEPQLKIDEIASLLETTSHKVSQTINSKYEKSFYDYVNFFRVNHFKNLLSNPENRKYTILALGIESGFNSKASLNRIFKQNTGMSPKQFQKTQF